VRELENLTERMVLIAKEDRITPENMPEELKFTTFPAHVPQAEMTHKQFKDIVKDQTEAIEKQVIAKVLEDYGGNVTRAALQLGLSRKGLQLKMIKYKLRK
jgi:DNA-binding NtrC family response regulator